jgi:actin-like ATPase involved in cell morphogenesis
MSLLYSRHKQVLSEYKIHARPTCYEEFGLKLGIDLGMHCTVAIAVSNTVVSLYPQVICSKTWGYVKPWIIPNTIYNVIFV